MTSSLSSMVDFGCSGLDLPFFTKTHFSDYFGLFVWLVLVRKPPVGQGLLVLEVSRAHKTTHHIGRTPLDE